jgi:SAM-dependent methyltransferase
MRFGRLRRHWDGLGKRDPFWAALTHPDKTAGGWEQDAFFQSGVDEIAAIVNRARVLGLQWSDRRALDFGCGPGRLTQALAARFQRADGLDISKAMLELARRLNRFGERCYYHLNTAPDLSLFGDAAFSFVYSTLTLQHMERRYSRTYIREFLRVTEPGGVIVFQVPSHRLSAVARKTEQTSVSGRLPRTVGRASIAVTPGLVEARAGEQVTLHAKVTNTSRHRWPSRGDSFGRHRLNIGNHWLYENGLQMVRDDARAALPHDVAPGETIEVLLYARAPGRNGRYLIEVDLVQEDSGWFAEWGGTSARIPCEVTGGMASVPPPSLPAPAPEAPPPSPFRERHPRVFRVMKVTRLRDLYWAGRYLLDYVKARRDRLILWGKANAYEPLKASIYEPTVPPLINWWNRLSFAPRMEMHPVPRREVEAIVAAGGGTVVAVDEDLTNGGYNSCLYFITISSTKKV